MKTDPTRILALTLLAWGGLASAQAPPRLAGEWKLNRGQSDDLEAKVREAVGGGKTVGQSAEEGARVELRKVILGILPALEEIEVEQSPTEVKLVDAEDNVRIFYFGREHVREGRLGKKLRCTTEWKGEQLVVSEVSEKSRLTEILTAVPTRKQLLHVVRLEDDRLKAPLEVRLVYDAEPPSPRN
jgi:hypothetical protein